MAKKEQPKSNLTPLAQQLNLLQTTQILKDVHAKFQLSASSSDPEVRKSTSISTGMLMSDLILSGGIYPGGWYTFFGAEGSCKSTHLMTILGNVFDNNVPLVMMFDYEGATDAGYMEQIFGRRLDVKRLFGIKDPDTGEWAVPPRIDYVPESVGEVFYRATSRILKSLPDKFYSNDEWWLGYERTKENISRFSDENCKKEGWIKSKKLSNDSGKIVLKSPDGGTMQALILLDSYPAMNSEADDDDDSNNALGMDARMHSKYIKRVKSKLKRKHSTVLGVNQLRLRPMSLGNPEYEPCGEALKYSSDCRVKQTPRSVPHATGMVEEEDSVFGGSDTYRYIHARTIKNKLGVPFLDGWYRLWVSDNEGKARGFDTVYDTYQYLLRTGQAEGSAKEENLVKKFDLKLVSKQGNPVVELNKLTWFNFKKLCLLEGNALKKHCEKLGLDKTIDLRKMCFKQLKSGFGLKLFFNHLNDIDAFEQSFDMDELEELNYNDMSDDQLRFWVKINEYDIEDYKELSRKKLIKAIEAIDNADD